MLTTVPTRNNNPEVPQVSTTIQKWTPFFISLVDTFVFEHLPRYVRGSNWRWAMVGNFATAKPDIARCLGRSSGLSTGKVSVEFPPPGVGFVTITP